MIFIDKQNCEYKDAAHKILTYFICRSWEKTSGRYINLDYRSLPFDFKKILFDEQKGYCCYCMRELVFCEHYKDTNNMTLEHIVPKSHREIGCYSNAKFPIDSKNISFQFDVKPPHVGRIPIPPFPHFLAYENLAASCNGIVINWTKVTTSTVMLDKYKTCNGARGNEQIIPLFLNQSAEQILQYESDGSITYDDEFENTIRVLNLNDDTLTKVRSAWCKIAREYGLEDVFNAHSEQDKKDILDDSFAASETIEKQLFLKPTVWSVFMQYYWFHDYFTKNPRPTWKSKTNN